MIQVIDGKIIKYRLPKVGTLKSGETVSGYDKLSPEILAEEGWLPLEDIKPAFDDKLEYLQLIKYEILFDRVVKVYEIKQLADLPVSTEKKMASLYAAIRQLVRVDEIPEEELKEMIYIYPDWNDLIGEFTKAGEYIRYRDKLYKVIKGITHQENWKPDEVPSEYLAIMPDNVIPIWKQPAGAHDAYKLGDKVIHNDIVYISIHDGDNTWEPGVFGWEAE